MKLYQLVASISEAQVAVLRLPASVAMPKFMQALHLEGFCAIWVDQAKIFDKATLMHALYQHCGFPAYFGFNWDALEDALSGLLPEAAAAIILLFDDFELLQARAPEVAETFLEIVEHVNASRQRAGYPPVRIVLLQVT